MFIHWFQPELDEAVDLLDTFRREKERNLSERSRMTLRVLYIVYSAIGSTAHSRPLNSLEQCICTSTV